MTVKIPLRLAGIDLRDAEAHDRIGPEFEELFWAANGGVSVAVLFSEGSSSAAVDTAVGWARRIANLIPGVTVAEAHDELVSISDIAALASVAPEAVRMWSNGKRRSSVRPFPAPRQVVGGASGGKTMNLYAWRETLSWIREVIGLDPEEGVEYLTDAEYAQLNAALTAIRTEIQQPAA